MCGRGVALSNALTGSLLLQCLEFCSVSAPQTMNDACASRDALQDRPSHHRTSESSSDGAADISGSLSGLSSATISSDNAWRITPFSLVSCALCVFPLHRVKGVTVDCLLPVKRMFLGARVLHLCWQSIYILTCPVGGLVFWWCWLRDGMGVHVCLSRQEGQLR